MEPTLLRFTAIGSVDDGKSTLIGRLLHDQRAVFEDQLESIRKVSGDKLDLAYITDGLRAEREQGITIDVAYRYFATPRRRFIIADTPGHEQYTRNMVTGASTAEVAVILLDATRGVLPQTLRHAYLSWLIGIRHTCVAINKMDAVGFSRERFESICCDFQRVAGGLPANRITFIPVSALEGDNVAGISERMPWHHGPTLLEYLETVETGAAAALARFRLPVQTVLRGTNGYRAYAGLVAAGRVKPGDEMLVLPSRRAVRIRSVHAGDRELEAAFAPMSVAVSLEEQVDLGRGDMVVDPQQPPAVARRLTAILFWMSEAPLVPGRPYLLKHTTQQVCAEVTRQVASLDLDSLQFSAPRPLVLNEIGRVELETHRPLFCDPYTENRTTGSFILIDSISNDTIAAGLIESADEQAVPAQRAAGAHSGVTVWLTGLSSAGKSTLAERVHERLRALSYRADILDGDVVRKQLSKGLGFSKEDRDENIRRIGFVAELLTRNGVIALVSAISPYRSIRDEIRSRIPNFIEIYVNAPLEVCEQRDLKGIYRKARAGGITGVTGIDDPYEPPLKPEIECRTDLEEIEESAEKIVRYIRDWLAEGKGDR